MRFVSRDARSVGFTEIDRRRAPGSLDRTSLVPPIVELAASIHIREPWRALKKLNRLAMTATAASYLWDGAAYEPDRSVGTTKRRI